MRRRNPVIAVAPIWYYTVHKMHNVKKIRRYIKEAKKAGADIVCFPESCVTKKDTVFINDIFIKQIQEECRRNSVWCIVTEYIKSGEKTYNTSILIGRDGRIRGRYKKINLYGDKDTAPGNRVRVFETDFARIGIAICWDLTYPGLFLEMRKRGAEIVFCPAQWGYDEISHKSMHRHMEINLLRSMILARAHENVFYIALCNPLMKDKRQVSYSAIASPHRILKELIDKEGLITAEVSLKEIRKFRKYYEK
jgi:predicted amidohydrolase